MNIQLITKILLETEMVKKFKNLYEEESSIKGMINLCATHIRNLYVPKDDYICKIDEVGDFFFIIFKGSVDIMRVSNYIKQMDVVEYFNILKTYYKNNDIYILNKTIAANYHVFPIKTHEFKKLDQKIYSLQYTKVYATRTIYTTNPQFDEIYKERQQLTGVEPEIQIDEERGNYIEFNEEVIEEVELDRFTCTIFMEEFFLKKRKGEFLEDVALDQKDYTRNYSCIASEDCYLGVLQKSDYISFIKHEKSLLRSKEISFVLDNFIFRMIPRHHFDKKYYDEFVYMDVTKNTVLCKADEEVTAVYFIKEGEVELSFSKSILDLNNMFNYYKKTYLPDYVEKIKYMSKTGKLLFLRMKNRTSLCNEVIKSEKIDKTA